MRRVIYTFLCIGSLFVNACTNLLDTDNILSEKMVTKTADLETVEMILETAGTLAEKLGKQSATVEKLILSGLFDADDLKCVRELPNIQVLDIKDISIVGGDKTYSVNMVGDRKLSDNEIGDFMFYSMKHKLSSIVLPDNIRKIGNEAFHGSDIETIAIPESVKNNIGEGAFKECHNLKTIIFPSMVSIPAYCFQSCTSLNTLTIPEGVVHIGNYAFSGCFSLEAITLPESLEVISPGVFSYTALKTISIPDKVRILSGGGGYDVGAFAGCSSLSSVKLSTSLIEIEKTTFKGCSSLCTIIIPDNITAIKEEAFIDCSSLKDITWSNQLREIGNRAFAACGLTKITLPEGVTSIGNAAFEYSELEEIYLPQTLKTIGTKAFHHCDELKTITIPESVVSVGDGTFAGSYKLHSIFWNTSATFPKVYSYSDSWENIKGGNPNCLLYLTNDRTQIADKTWKNIILNGQADEIILSSERGDFYCPKEFKTQKISYTQEFGLPTYPNEAAGWKSISLPFTVTQIKHEDGRVLAPFNNDIKDAKPFWLRRLNANGFENVTQIEADAPYIISMPNNEKYAEEYIVTGKVTFSAGNASTLVTIPVTDKQIKEEGPSFLFCTNYQYIPQSVSAYVLNEAGSRFVRSEREALPFEAYVINKSLSNAPAMYSIENAARTRNVHVVGNKPSIDDM